MASKARHELRTLLSEQRFARPSFQNVVVESTFSSVNANMALTTKANRKVSCATINMQAHRRMAQLETSLAFQTQLLLAQVQGPEA
eukprot:4666269-Amphidinium_carterae.1